MRRPIDLEAAAMAAFQVDRGRHTQRLLARRTGGPRGVGPARCRGGREVVTRTNMWWVFRKQELVDLADKVASAKEMTPQALPRQDIRSGRDHRPPVGRRDVHRPTARSWSRRPQRLLVQPLRPWLKYNGLVHRRLRPGGPR